jgi:DNA-binding transcriptional regulator of glucitol operon
MRVTAELITFLVGAVVAAVALGAWVVVRVRAGDSRGGGRRW